MTKAADVPEKLKSLPDVGTGETEKARLRLEDNEGGERKSRRARTASFFGMRRPKTNSEDQHASDHVQHADGDHVQEQGQGQGQGQGQEGEEEVEEQEPRQPVALDILRTARINKKALQLQATHTYPEVKLTPWGDNWAIDSFALIHNAIKAELKDLFFMADVMQRRKLLLTLHHINIFYEWWDDFREFVTVALTIEEEVLYNWVASRYALRGSFRHSERMRVNGAFRNVVNNITDYHSKFLPSLPVGERLNGLLELIANFDQLLLHYDRVAQQLPTYLETLFKQKDKEENTRHLIAAFRASDGYNRNLVLLARWMPDRTWRKWVVQTMRTRDVLQYKGWKNVIHKEHVAVAAAFEDLVMGDDEDLGAPVIGAAMAINEEMRAHIDNNRVSVRSLPTSAFS